MVKKNKEKVVTEALNAKATEDLEASDAKQTETAKGNVTVACGIPMGLKLELSTGSLILKGLPMSHLVSAFKQDTFLPAGKYGLTTVTAAQWEEILGKYKNFDFIKNGVVFACEEKEATVEKAKELSETKKMGFEQADPKKAATKKVKDTEG